MSLLDAARREIEREVAASVPEGKRGALVFVGDAQGGELMVAARIGDHWQLAGGVVGEWGSIKDVKPTVKVMGSW
jgi:hypothetical protein